MFDTQRSFEFSEKMVHGVLNLENTNKTYYCILGNENPALLDPLQYLVDYGARTNVIELDQTTKSEIRYWCRNYMKALKLFQTFFVIGMMAATFLVVRFDLFDNLMIMVISMCFLMSAFLPNLQSSDRTMDSSYISPEHFHIYTYMLADGQHPSPFYRCVCGKILEPKK